jgi:hypothetical protein
MLLMYRLGRETVAAVSMEEMAFPRAFPKPFVLFQQFFPLASFPKAITIAPGFQFILSSNAQVQGIWCKSIYIRVPNLLSHDTEAEGQRSR